MSAHSFTPGPWNVRHLLDGNSIRSEAGRTIANMVADCDTLAPVAEQNANARLIAAAPDLLHALQELYEDCEIDCYCAELSVTKPCAVCKASAAIAKATQP